MLLEWNDIIGTTMVLGLGALFMGIGSVSIALGIRFLQLGVQ